LELYNATSKVFEQPDSFGPLMYALICMESTNDIVGWVKVEITVITGTWQVPL